MKKLIDQTWNYWCALSHLMSWIFDIAFCRTVCFGVFSFVFHNWSILLFLFLSGMILSVIFIIITLLVYTFIPVMRNLYGKCLLCYLVSLAIAYSLIAALQLNGSNYIEPYLCYSIAYTIYFSFLSTFLWLNVMNFDLWLNFQWVIVNHLSKICNINLLYPHSLRIFRNCPSFNHFFPLQINRLLEKFIRSKATYCLYELWLRYTMFCYVFNVYIGFNCIHSTWSAARTRIFNLFYERYKRDSSSSTWRHFVIVKNFHLSFCFRWEII